MSDRPFRPWVLVTIAAVSLLYACDDAVVEPDAGTESGETPASADGQMADLGRGLALALDDASVRQQVLEDMRDSPFPEHSLHLQSYLESDGGRVLAERAADRLGISPGELRARVEEHDDLQLFMPSTLQRGTWEGEGPVTVFATLLRDEDVASGGLTAWTSDGETLGLSPSDALESPTLAVIPARHDFGDDTGAALRAGGEADRSTVAEEATLPVRGPEEAEAAAGDEGPGGAAVTDGGGFRPGEAGISDWASWDGCRTPVSDWDDDGLINTCELQLARAFRPELAFHPGEGLQSRETYWAVRVQDFSERLVFVFYALGYHDDSGHMGDSEFIQLRIVFRDGRWKLRYADYSAHFDGANDGSATYLYTRLDFADHQYRGRPVAYVANGKHAAFNSVSHCDDNILDLRWADDCADGFREDVEVVRDRNLGNNHGSTTILEDCVGSEEGTAGDGHNLSFGTECFWSDRHFRGWHGTSMGVKPYAEILEYFRWNTNPVDNSTGGGRVGCEDDGPIDNRRVQPCA